MEAKQYDDRFRSTTSIIPLNENGLKASIKRQTVEMDEKGRPNYMPPIKKIPFKCEDTNFLKGRNMRAHTNNLTKEC